MAFSFGGAAASTPAFGTPTTPAFGFGAATPAPAVASTPAFSFGGTPAFGSSTPAAFGASTAPTFGASSTPAFGFGSAPAFGATSTPAFGASSAPAFGAPAATTSAFSFNSTSTAAPTSAFGGSLFGGGTMTPFGAGPAPQQAQQVTTSLATTDGRPVSHATKWDDICAAGQNQLLELEKVIVKLREESAILDADERLGSPVGAKQGLPAACTALEQDIAALASRGHADDATSDVLRDHVIQLLRSTESTLRAYQRSHAWREAAKLPPGQALPSHIVEQLSVGVVLPSPFLAASIESYSDQVGALRGALGALQSVLPGDAARGPSPAAGPAEMEAALRNLQDCLLASAARVQAVADGVADRKAARLAVLRRGGDYSDPFQAAAEQEVEGRRAAEARAAEAFSGSCGAGEDGRGGGTAGAAPALPAGPAGTSSLFGGVAAAAPLPGASTGGLFGSPGGLFGAQNTGASSNQRKARVGRR